MNIPATQRLFNDNDSGNHNLIMQLSTPQDRVHQVASLCIKNKKYPIFEGINTVGRNPTSDIVLTDSTVSKNHAEIEAHSKTAFVCDLGSSNKTRLSNEILRPQRFYQVNDGVQLTFGTVNGRYLFLRDLDNSIIVPETPAPNAKLRHSLSTVRSKKLSNSLIDNNDKSSTIASTSSLNNQDEVIVMPSSKSQPSSSRVLNRSVHVQIDGTEFSIHDKDIHKMETQQYENEPNKLSKRLHDIEMQKLNTTDETDIDDMMDTVKNPIKKSQQCIYEIKRQNVFTIGEVDDNTSSNKLNLPGEMQQSFHDMETQKLDKVVIENTMINDDGDDINIAETQEFNSDAKVEMLTNKTNEDKCKISGPNSYIIKETDDEESETDEDGEFSNLHISNEKNNALKTQINKIDEEDSETDEDGEFEELRHNCLTNLMDPNKQIPDKDENNKNVTMFVSRINTRNELKSPCLNERFDCESPISPNVDQLCTKQIGNMVEDADSDQSLATTQIVQSNCQETLPIIEKNATIINCDDTSTQSLNDLRTNHGTNLLNEDDGNVDEMTSTASRLTRSKKGKSVESTRSLYENFISDDDDMAPTQIIEMPKQKMPIQQLSKLTVEANDDDDDILSTQIVHTPKKQIIVKRFAKNNLLVDNDDNDEITTHINTSNTLIKNHSENDDDSTQIIDQLSKMNDSVEPNKCIGSSQDVSNKRGETLDDYYFDDSTPTQVIDVQNVKIHSKNKSRKARATDSEKKNVTKNRKSTKSESDDDDNKMSNRTIHKMLKIPRISLRLQHNINTSLPVVGGKLKKMENLNDSISKNLANLFGEESQEKKLDEPIRLATQQLQDILDPTENNENKNIKRLRSADKLNSSNSSEIESQEVYFSKLHSKRKRNAIQSSQDSTQLESEKNTPPTKNLEFAAKIVGLKHNVAVCSNETMGVCELPAKKRQGNSEKAEVKLTAKVSDEELDQKEEDDILAGLPEVRIYGTASYPASPSSSVCSLDDWELFEKKRQKRLKVSTAKKPLTTIKSLSRISSDNEKKNKAITKENPTTIKLSSTKKMLESSDDDLDFEDLKKMAVGFIAADTKTKNLSINLEKIPTTKKYQTSTNYRIKQGPISPVENSHVLPQRRARGRQKKMIDPILTLQNDEPNLLDDDKSTVGAPSRKRQRLNEKSGDAMSESSNFNVESREIRMILEESTSVEAQKRTKEIPAKFRDETDSPMHETASKQKKSKFNVVISPSGFNRSRVQHKVLFTGVFSSNYEAEVKQCGGTIVEKPEQATILVTDKIRRTNKFFCAISRHIPIVSINWIENSFREKHFLDWSQYILKDPVTETKYNFKLQQSLERAKKKLLDGYTFIITGKVTKPGPEEIKSMIQMSGGKAVVRSPKLWLPNTIIISCTDDVPKVRTILSKVPKQLKIPVYTTEFLLLGILKQELNFNANQVEL